MAKPVRAKEASDGREELAVMEQDDLCAKMLADAKLGDVGAIERPAKSLFEDERVRERIERAIVATIVKLVETANGNPEEVSRALRSLSEMCVRLGATGAVRLLAELGMKDLAGKMPDAADGGMGSIYSALATLGPDVLGHGAWLRVIKKRPDLAHVAARAIISYQGASGLSDVLQKAIPEMGKDEAIQVARQIAGRFDPATLKAMASKMPKDMRERLRGLLPACGGRYAAQFDKAEPNDDDA
jgi:hypothetical protein